MEKKKMNYAGITIVLLALSILIMSVGYAVQAQVLNINGSALIESSPRWDIHFENISITNGSVTDDLVNKPASITNVSSTYITFDVKLPNFGNFYEFSLDVVNDGNIDAIVSSVLTSGSENYKDYLNYSITYVDNDNGVHSNDTLLKGETKRIKVRIENVYQTNEIILEDKMFNMSFAIQYVQK